MKKLFVILITLFISLSANAYNFEVQYATKDILNLDTDGKCSNPKCKCHKK